MITQNTTGTGRLLSTDRTQTACATAPTYASDLIARRFGARAITLLTTSRTLEDGRVLPARLSANDCYVAMEESCRKMTRVAVRRFETDARMRDTDFETALDQIFPDAPAYLARCIRSVISDEERMARRDVPTVSLDQPFAASRAGETGLCLRDTIASTDSAAQPEDALIAEDERARLRVALAKALQTIPENYREALKRDIARERERRAGGKVQPESDRERQTVCRARAALTQALKREYGADNPYVHMLAQSKGARPRQKPPHSRNWTAERQRHLYQRLMGSTWAERSVSTDPEADVEEAVVNEVGIATKIPPPSPEMRQAVRVMDTYTIGDDPTAETSEAQKHYREACRLRRDGKIPEAIQQYRAAYEIEPDFFAALNEVGVLLSQLGNLRDALKVYLTIIDNARAGEHRYIAATNAADIYLTWFDAGRNRERNIERATFYARMAMKKPTPMRACNLMLAYVKDRYFVEARQVMDHVLNSNLPHCSAETFLRTLFQIRDTDLVSWWSWLDEELGKEDQ